MSEEVFENNNSELHMEELLELVVEEGSSDLHIEVGVPPLIRMRGDLCPLDLPPLTAEDTERLVREIASEEQMQQIEKNGTVDFGFPYYDKARFRVSAFRQKKMFGTVLRQIPNKLLTFNQLGLNNIVKDILYKPRGLVLVTGPTGSGKSTTLASMINIINEERPVHIITIEDPIEFYHPHKKACVIQREVGDDVPSFEDALRRALRQDPEVILVGEMRDLETIRAAISAAETGHLVFGTLHTTGAARTVDRIVDAFPADQQEQIRTQMAESLVAVISQVLLPRIDKPGRVAAFEIMISTPSIKALIRENKTFRLSSEIQTGAKYGMNTLDNHLLELYERKIISYQELMMKAQDQAAVLQKLEENAKG